MPSGEIFRAAMDALPAAALIRDTEGRIVYANETLEKLFSYAPGELVDQSILVLVPPNKVHRGMPDIATCIATPNKLQLGIDHVLLARSKAGNMFRVILTIGSAPSARGFITTCTFRAFLAEVDDLRRHARAVTSLF